MKIIEVAIYLIFPTKTKAKKNNDHNNASFSQLVLNLDKSS